MASLADILQSLTQSQSGYGAKGLMQPVGDVIPFKFMYCDNADKLKIGKTLNKHKHLIGEHEGWRLLVCFQTSANLFRSRFERFR